MAGVLTPRMLEHLRSLRATPVAAPSTDTTTEMSHAEDRDTEAKPQGGTPMELATGTDRRPPPS